MVSVSLRLCETNVCDAGTRWNASMGDGRKRIPRGLRGRVHFSRASRECDCADHGVTASIDKKTALKKTVASVRLSRAGKCQAEPAGSMKWFLTESRSHGDGACEGSWKMVSVSLRLCENNVCDAGTRSKAARIDGRKTLRRVPPEAGVASCGACCSMRFRFL